MLSSLIEDPEMDEKIAKAIKLLENEVEQLEVWANECLNPVGAWTTQYVEPMRERALFLRQEIAKLQS
jgi:hypothetical protein